MILGEMPRPADFPYDSILELGRPRHPEQDSFRLKHPVMDPGHRAKIFAPFDALAGFDEAVSARDVLYENRREMSEEEAEELDRALRLLSSLTANGRLARENRVSVSVTFFVPCTDPGSPAFGIRGRYRTVSGICRNVDPLITRTLTVGSRAVPLRDLAAIEIIGEANAS